MTIDELPEQLRVVDETDASEIGGKQVRAGYVIANDRWETLTHVAYEKMATLTVPGLLDVTAQGRDVDHITRVTGYFSKVSGWNKGKARELKDRARVKVT